MATRVRFERADGTVASFTPKKKKRATSSKRVRSGDIVILKDPTGRISYAGMSPAKVVRVGPKNVTVIAKYRFRPDGPWFESEHRVPRGHVVRVVG